MLERFEGAPDDWPSLGEDVHVWLVDLDGVEDAARELDDAERERMERFHLPEHGQRFAAARAALRRILSCYVGGRPETLRFEAGPQGKPALTNEPLPFNLSHSGDRALVAVTRKAPVGVDIEMHRELTDRDALARRFFSPSEVLAFEDLPPEERQSGFFRCWTRKEAFIKCSGRGLTQPLDSFDVSIDREDARVLDVRDPELGGAQWFLRALDVGQEAEGAVLLRSTEAVVRTWRWSGA